MKAFLALCLAALLITASAEYSFDIISSTIDSVTFEYDCDETSECKNPGEEYCGNNQIDTLFCKDHENICEVTCLPLKQYEADDTHIYTTSINVAPAERKPGDEITVTLTDNKGKLLTNWGVNIYYGGRWVTETVEGAARWGGSMAVMSVFTDSEYVDGELLVSGYTDRQGKFAFTAEEPGHYVLYATDKYVRFKVADASGDVYNCSNGVCEEELGEDEGVCPEDCEEEQSADSPPVAIVCGDGVCDAVEKGECPEDCQPDSQDQDDQNDSEDTPLIPPSPPIVCGDGTCDPSEQGQCPQDCQPQTSAGQGGDNTIMIIALIAIIVAAVVILVFLMMTGRLGSKKQATAAPAQPQKAAPAPAQTQKQTQAVSSIKCPKCGADNPIENTFCISCGQRLK
jgi:hypothetical protein